MKRYLGAALRAAIASSAAALASLAQAQGTPSLFVSLTSGRPPSKSDVVTALTQTIAAPGNGWTFSAAAPVEGTTWNIITRPTPIPSNRNTKPGLYVCNSANNTALTSATGEADAAKLTISLDIQDLDPGSSRTEPNGGRAGATELGPLGLMDTGWNIYRAGNFSVHKVSGIKPGAHYVVYFYGSSEGTPGGARFTLDASNVPQNGQSVLETSGSPTGNVFESVSGVVSLTKPAAPMTESMPNDSTTWGKLHAVADESGSIVFRTSKNFASTHYVNGYQLVPFPRPTFTAQPPAELEVMEGKEVVLSASATGEGAMSYSWRKDGAAITGSPSATTSELRLSPAGAAAAGTYQLVVSNPGGEITSSPATLRVTLAPRKVETPARPTERVTVKETKPAATKQERRSWPVR
jgi:hypothetical protein